MVENKTEKERIMQVYEQRKEKIPSNLYSFFNRANLFFIQGRERAILEAFKKFTVYTSILDINMKQSIAKEMLRVLKPDGIILWYDYHMNNPKNPDVRGVKKKEIYELFRNCDIFLKRITLAPPITRLIAPYSWLACYLLEKLKIFNTHYLGVIKKLKS